MDDDRWVLFDLDGTLFDYDAAAESAVAATLRDAGLEPSEELFAAYARINARHWVALERGETTAARLRLERWEELLAEFDVEGVDIPRLSERYLIHLAAGSQLIEGAEQVVAAVAAHHPIAYITNGLADVQRPRLAASPLAGYTEVAVISDEVGFAKPHRAIFEAALAGLGDPPAERVTMVGDNLTADIGGAARLGMTTVWLAGPDIGAPTDDVFPPTHRIADIRELPAVLGLED